MNAAAAFLDIFSRMATRPAVCEPGGRSITYDRLGRQTVALAAELRRQGMTPGDRVLLQTPNGIVFAASALAVLLAGGVPVLIEPGLGDEVYLSRLRSAAPRWWLVHPLVLWVNRLPGLTAWLRRRELDVPPLPPAANGPRKIPVTHRRLQRLAATGPLPDAFTPADREAGDDGLLIFTGGTTSLPKGVRLSHGALDAYIANITSAVADLTLENFLADTPQQVLYALRLGRTAHITKGRKARRARLVRELIAGERVDAYFGSPYVWTEMAAQAGPQAAALPASLKTVLLGGAPVTSDFLAALRGRLHPATRVLALYGMTEVGPVCFVAAEDKIAYRGEGDLVGRTLDGVRVEIAEAHPETGIGEVVVHSSSLFTGYLDQPERPAEQGLATGDYGKIVQVGGRPMLALLGRKKDMIIRNGVNIYPISFEASLRAMTDPSGRRLLRECALVGVWNERRQDEDVVLFIEPAAGVEPDLEYLKREAARLCGSDAKPAAVLIRRPIPVTGRQNKVDKQALRDDAAQRYRQSQPA